MVVAMATAMMMTAVAAAVATTETAAGNGIGIEVEARNGQLFVRSVSASWRLSLVSQFSLNSLTTAAAYLWPPNDSLGAVVLFGVRPLESPARTGSGLIFLSALNKEP